jgi:hypothetical protein
MIAALLDGMRWRRPVPQLSAEIMGPPDKPGDDDREAASAIETAMSDLTPDEADEALAKYSPDDVSFAVAYATKHQVDPVWREALERFTGKERNHRRGRRG